MRVWCLWVVFLEHGGGALGIFKSPVCTYLQSNMDFSFPASHHFSFLSKRSGLRRPQSEAPCTLCTVYQQAKYCEYSLRYLLLSASTYFIRISTVCVVSACCVICTLPHLGIRLVFYSVAISRAAFFCCALSYVPGTLALDLPTTLNLKRLVFLCLTVCDHRICI